LHLQINQSWRLNSDEIFKLCHKVGWVLGRPSDVLIRADCIERDPAAWVTEISADFVTGIIAATRGDVVMLPAGNVVNVNHDAQDTRTQGAGKGLVRMVQSEQFLLARHEADIVRFAKEWAAINLFVATRNALAGLYFRQITARQAWSMLLFYAMIALKAYANGKSRSSVRAARQYRNALKGAPNIDNLMAQSRC
jgi:hypothetical protein